MANIQDVWISEKESVWCAQIDAYWKRVEDQKKKTLEEEMDKLDPQLIRDSTDVAWRDFLANKYIPWKHTPGRFYKSIQRKFIARYAGQEQQSLLSTIKSRIFACDPGATGELLGIVDEIYQFGIPSASGLLSLLFPSRFGTVDKFAIESLQRIEEFKGDILIQGFMPKSISLDDAVRAISIMRVKAGENNKLFGTTFWTARRIDMVLWSTRESGNQTGFGKPSRNTWKIHTKSRRAAWEVVEQVAKFLAESDPGKLVSASAFAEAMKQSGYKGVQASDYVYGTKNKDPRSGTHPVFVKVGRGIYRYAKRDK
jgi:hypothetical protein